MGAGSGGSDAVRMMNRQSREASRYREERRARRASIGALDEVAGAGEHCATCGGWFDHNLLLRRDDAWVCELCDAGAEADRVLASPERDRLARAGLVALGTLVAVELVGLAAGAGVGLYFGTVTAAIVAAPGLAAWAGGIRRTGTDSTALHAAHVAGTTLTVVHALALVRLMMG